MATVKILSCAIFLLVASIQAAPSCKAIPSSSRWPAKSAWDALNQQVGGRLTQPLPPGAACHPDQANYDAAACREVMDKFKLGSFHVNHPTSSMWQNYNNYSCMPEPSAPCTNSGYPVYVVAVESPEDVKAAVDFARNHSVRLNIKSTGHDFLGRSVQPNSLSIWTHNLRSQSWHNTSFSPEGCNISIPGPAVTAGAGNQWADLSTAANARDVMLISGASKTVSIGGFLSAGGHGALSAKYGLGADMVLEIEAVTADGRIIKANECQNQDYFWAMRGGGGSTYAVATKFTIQAIRTVPTAKYNGKLNSWDQIIYMHQQWPKLAAVGISGYMNGYPARSQSASISMTLPNATSNTVLEKILDPILAGMATTKETEENEDNGPWTRQRLRRRNRRSTKITKGTYSHFETWAEAQNEPGIFDADEVEEARVKLDRRQVWPASFPGTGTNKIITSWLWSAEDCTNPKMPAALRGAFDSETQLLNDMTMGEGTWKPPYLRGGSNAVNPAFRTASMRPAAELQWYGTNPSTLRKKKADALRFGGSLKSLDPDGGTYSNEGDPEFPDWQHAFWGSNYERLLGIKRTVDPEGVFYCRACVGSELWEDRDGELCRK